MESDLEAALGSLAELRALLQDDIAGLATLNVVEVVDDGGRARMLALVEATEQELVEQLQAAVQAISSEVCVRQQPQERLNRLCLTPCARVVQQPLSDTAYMKPSPLEVKPQPLPTRDLPVAVWEDHLLPLLTCKDAGRLECTCQALRGVVREHFVGDVGPIDLGELPMALTTFPRARTLDILDEDGLVENSKEALADCLRKKGHMPDLNDDGERYCVLLEALINWLREGDRGQYLTKVTSACLDDLAQRLVYAGLRQSLLPSLKYIFVALAIEAQRASLIQGLAGAMRELELQFKCIQDDHVELERQLVALGVVHQLPNLVKLVVWVGGKGNYTVPWPPFIPPSLKALRISTEGMGRLVNESFLRSLSDMLHARKTTLERLEIEIPSDLASLGEGLTDVARILRCSSPTLKGLRMTTHDPYPPPDDDDQEAQFERLRVHWADVLAGVSTCQALQMLLLASIKVEPWFPPGAALGRLTHLEISDHVRGCSPSGGVMGLWELMASGGLPALAKLSVRLEGLWGRVEEIRNRVAPAFEAVAGTLTHLCLAKHRGHPGLEVDVELGVAVGWLRRLKDLALDLSDDGRVYHAVAQGLAAHETNPLPTLQSVTLMPFVTKNADQLASLVLPSVRVFNSSQNEQTALLTACALRQKGYKHAWYIRRRLGSLEAVRAVQSYGENGLHLNYNTPLWVIFGRLGEELPDDI
jgi:hypothetical protein